MGGPIQLQVEAPLTWTAWLGSAGRWGAPSPAASPAKASGPTEGQVKGKYLAMTLMQVRGECTKLGNTPPTPNGHL
eukprot:COSAG04_NODE_8201_length_1007_cov_1.768722_1_plen_76_part_00